MDDNVCLNDNDILINILTRSGNREEKFLNLKNSINNQEYKNIRHIISNDNSNCSYLNNDLEVYFVEKIGGEVFYNLYLNILASKVESGWVIIMDDDSKIIENSFLSKLSQICKESNENDIIIFQAKVGNRNAILPSDIHMKKKIFTQGGIDMVCFCVYFTVFNYYKFTSKRCGDYNFLNKLRSSKNYNFKYIDNLPIGIWANYNGHMSGKND